MPAPKPYTITALLLLLCIASSLLNAPVFGGATLMAYFLYCITASVVGILFLGEIFSHKTRPRAVIPLHVACFSFFVVYIFVHGLAFGPINLVHYYWGINLALLISVFYSMGNKKARIFLFKGITMIAFLESLVVVLQYIRVLPSANELFTCTGTWVNPNVSAIFLSMAFYAVFETKAHHKNRKFVFIVLIAMSTAIVLLKCRTAFIVSLVFLVGEYARPLIGFCQQRLKLNKKWPIAIGACMVVIFFWAIVFGVKKGSTGGRIQVWKNSLSVIAEKPVLGHGIGFFERDYNLFVASNGLPSNDHVNMPYNDFLEIGVEGGIVAVLLWAAFLFLAIKWHVKNGISLLPIIAFTIVQLVNFGFQAIPAFALFLLYLATDAGVGAPVATKAKIPAAYKFSPIIYYGVPIISVLLFFRETHLAKAFYKKNEIAESSSPQSTINAYALLEDRLDGYQRFHEAYGDAYLQLRQYMPALAQYQQSAKSCSDPSVLSKTGYCYQQLNNYDSSQYYYQLVQHLQPHAFAPRMALLKLYEQKRDTAKMLQKAMEITEMPIKVKSGRVDEIKAYAQKIEENIATRRRTGNGSGRPP